jgi:hypothetical protein
MLVQPPSSRHTKWNKIINAIADKVKQWYMQRTMTLRKREDAEVEWGNELLKIFPTFT